MGKGVADRLGAPKLLAAAGAVLRMAQKRLAFRLRHFGVKVCVQTLEKILAVHAHALLSLFSTI